MYTDDVISIQIVPFDAMKQGGKEWREQVSWNEIVGGWVDFIHPSVWLDNLVHFCKLNVLKTQF